MACRQLQDHVYKKAAGGVESQINIYIYIFLEMIIMHKGCYLFVLMNAL